MYRTFDIVWDRLTAKLLEIEQTGILPDLSIGGLFAELTLNLLKPFLIYVRLHAAPLLFKPAYILKTCIIMIAKFLPEALSTFHPILPREMMKPEQIDFRTAFHIGKLTADWFMILTHCITTCQGTIKPNPYCIRLMILRWRPVFPRSFGCPPRTRPIMFIRRKDVMQSQWHHIVYCHFMALQHHLANRIQKLVHPLLRIDR